MIENSLKRRPRWSRLPKAGTPAGLMLAALLAATTVLAQDAELTFRKTSHLSGEEQLTQAQAYLTKMQSLLHQVRRVADRARTERDLIKLNCVNDKLIQIQGHLRVGEQVQNALKMTVARGDEGGRTHEFAKLTIVYQKVTVLAQEAEACIGEEIAYVGRTRVDVQVDPDIDQQHDPTVEPPVALPLIRPPVASPFR